jgi:Ca2+-binding EF-hand superfamily protein
MGSQSSRTSGMGSQSSREPRDIMASGPQNLQLAAAPGGPRKGVHTGVSLAKLSPAEREEHELRTICEQIGVKAAQKFGTVREAFRYLDSDHDGKISRSEMRYFFRAYNFDESVADRFYNKLDRDGSGELEYGEFMKFVAPYVQPDFAESCSSPECNSETSTRTPSPHSSTSESRKDLDPEMQSIFEFIGRKASEKFSNAREALRYVDRNNDGSISKDEMQCFFRAFNLTDMEADKFFDYMDVSGSGEIDYRAFVRFLGPFFELPGTAAVMRQGSAPSHPCTRSLLSHEPSLSCASECSDSQMGAYIETGNLSQAITEKEMRDIMKDIGEKLPLKFKHVRDAFRPLDLGHDGKITPTEMRSFLRGFGWPAETADRLFKALDEDASGAIDFNTFLSHFDAVLGPANRLAYRCDIVPDTNEKLSKEVNQLAAILKEKLLTKYGSARQAFRTLDLENSGHVTLSEMRRFFLMQSMPLDAATKVFKYLRKDSCAETIDLDDFLALFGPTRRPGGRWRTVQELQ